MAKMTDTECEADKLVMTYYPSRAVLKSKIAEAIQRAEQGGYTKGVTDQIELNKKADEKFFNLGLLRGAEIMYEWLPKTLGLNHKAAEELRKEANK